MQSIEAKKGSAPCDIFSTFCLLATRPFPNTNLTDFSSRTDTAGSAAEKEKHGKMNRKS